MQNIYFRLILAIIAALIHIDIGSEILNLKISLKIRNQRSRKPPISNFHPNQAKVDIFIRHIGSTILNSKILSKDS